MKYLLSSQNLKYLESFLSPQSKSILSFDFDGTLAPIVSRPMLAKLNPQTRSLLQKLGPDFSLAIISGRSVQDLSPRLGLKSPSLFTIGNHGIENPYSSGKVLGTLKTICKNWKQQLHSADQEYLAKNQIEIEDKQYTLSVHFRRSPHPGKTQKTLPKLIQQLTPEPRIIPGKFVFNVVPAGCPNKGTALLELIQRTRSQRAFYIGDDDTDEDVFRLKDPRILTVRVGNKRKSFADFYIREQNEIQLVLKKLVQISN